MLAVILSFLLLLSISNIFLGLQMALLSDIKKLLDHCINILCIFFGFIMHLQLEIILLCQVFTCIIHPPLLLTIFITIVCCIILFIDDETYTFSRLVVIH